jgi:hypothetical protein
MSLIWRPGFQFDVDASNYIEAVEAADEIASPGIGALETGVRYAINNFVIGCKQDGIWDAIKASCILAGARTLAGALVPLVGTAPTNFNFVAGDYNRKTGLKGDGSTKYLDSTYAYPAALQNNAHVSVYVSSGGDNNTYIGALNVNGTQVVAGGYIRLNSSSTLILSNFSAATGLVAVNRANASQITTRISNVSTVENNTSAAVLAETIHVFQRNYPVSFNPTAARLSFYSIGESLDLAALDGRVTDLMSAIGAAIP